MEGRGVRPGVRMHSGKSGTLITILLFYVLGSRPCSGLIWKCATALTFEKLAQELAASLMAASILSGANFDVRPAEMEKEVASLFARSLCARSVLALGPIWCPEVSKSKVWEVILRTFWG